MTMIDLYSEALAADYKTVCEIMYNIDEYQYYFESNAKKFFDLRESYIKTMESEAFCDRKLSDEERSEVYNNIKDCSVQYRKYIRNVEICKSLKYCSFFYVDNEEDKMYFFREAVTNVINREDK